MANAILLAPAPATASGTGGTPQLGAPEYTLNDYAGVVYQVACDADGRIGQVEYDLGALIPVDTVMVFGLELFPATGELEVRLTDSFGGELVASTMSPYAGDVIVGGKGISLWMSDAPLMARHVRIRFTAPGSGAAVKLSRVVIGKRIQLERNFANGGTIGVRDLGSLDFSARGVLMRRRARKLRTAQLTFSNIRKDEVEAQTGPLLEQVGNTEMIALVTDPSEDPLRETRCFFGPLVGDLGHTRRNAVAFEAKISLVSIF